MTHKHLIILTAEKITNEDSVNEYNTEKLRRYLSRMTHSEAIFDGFKALKTIYGDLTRNSFAVMLRDENTAYQLDMLNQLNDMFDQESVMYSDHNRLTSMVYKSGVTDKIGNIVSVSKKEALSLSYYSVARVNSKDLYFTIKE